MYYLIYKQFKGIIKINHQKNIQVGKKKRLFTAFLILFVFVKEVKTSDMLQ